MNEEILENSPPEEAEETIMDKSLRYYNFIQAKKLCDIEDGINWSKNYENVKMPLYVPSKVEKKKVGWKVFFKEMFKNLIP